jgi:hypothetical protein
MRRRMAFQTWIICTAALFLAAVGYAGGELLQKDEWIPLDKVRLQGELHAEVYIQEAMPSVPYLIAEIHPLVERQRLPAACRAAKADFHPIGAADVAEAKRLLLETVERLDDRLTQDGANGDAWRKYLKWDVLQNELRGDKQPDQTLLMRVYACYNADYAGLDLVWFLDVQRALHNYIATAAVTDNQRVRAAYEKTLDELAAALERYLAAPATQDALTINESIRRLQSVHQAPGLIEAIQQDLATRPNVYAEISADVVGAGLAESVDDVTDICDVILGTDIVGTAHTVGRTKAALAPQPDAAVIDALFFGTTTSDSVGYHGPVTIFSDSTTRLAACKRIWIDQDGLSSHPATSSAETDVVIRDIQSHKGRQLIEKMAWRRAEKQQAKAEAIASCHAEQRLNERIDRQADETLDKANQTYVEKFRRPFTERNLFPQTLAFSTTEKSLFVVALQAGGKLAAPGAPPPVVDGADMTLRIHESAVNNLAFDALAGRIAHEEKLQATVTDLLGHLPEKMKGDDDGKPWAITFAPQRPITVSFADGGFKITLCGAKYYKGSDAHPAMNVTAAYKIERTPTGFKAVRQGDIEVFPPDFQPGSGQKISAREKVISTLLGKRFAKVFEPELLGEGLELPGRWKAAGKLMPIQVECRDGWLVIAWKRTPASSDR